MPDTKHYDLIVIGGGSGMRVMSHAVNEYGWKVALVEEGPLGGTCLNRGCIPSKILIHTADIVEEIKNAGKLGIDARVEHIDFPKVIARASLFVDDEARATEARCCEEQNLDLYKTRAEFVDNKTVKVGSDSITADRIVIAAGTRPVVPPIEGLLGIKYITSTEALRLKKQPKSMIIIGGGYIATELGHFYGALGTAITVVEMGDVLLAREDKDIAETFTKLFSEKYAILLGHKVVKVRESGELKIVTVEDKGGSTKELQAEALLVSVGRAPNSDVLKLANTGIGLDEKGYVKVNEYMETSVPGVWALGDIVGKAPFKHAANFEADHVALNIKEENAKKAVDYSLVPHAIFSSPQIAGIGLTEQGAVEKEINYEIRRYEYKRTGMGKALGEENGFIKYIIDPAEDIILGCHILGPQASVLIHEVVIAMSAAGGRASAIRDAIHIHPALSEIVQRAL